VRDVRVNRSGYHQGTEEVARASTEGCCGSSWSSVTWGSHFFWFDCGLDVEASCRGNSNVAVRFDRSRCEIECWCAEEIEALLIHGRSLKARA
jgi:hypothetical protein